MAATQKRDIPCGTSNGLSPSIGVIRFSISRQEFEMVSENLSLLSITADNVCRTIKSSRAIKSKREFVSRIIGVARFYERERETTGQEIFLPLVRSLFSINVAKKHIYARRTTHRIRLPNVIGAPHKSCPSFESSNSIVIYLHRLHLEQYRI